MTQLSSTIQVAYEQVLLEMIKDSGNLTVHKHNLG